MVDSETTKLSAEKNLFLEILRETIHDGKYESEGEETFQYLEGILRLSSIHMVFPMVVDFLYKKYPDGMELYKKTAVNKVTREAMKTASFLFLYQQMMKEGLSPIVIKGIVCRSLYPEPELRSSVDEDLLIDPKEMQKYHSFLIKQGFQAVDPDAPFVKTYEVSYKNPQNGLYLEVHNRLFPPADDIYDSMNKLFEIMEKPVSMWFYDTEIRSLGYTDHLLYMIFHAYKHLIYSGIGIRQLCDMTLFAEEYGKQIDWDRITECIKQQNLTVFAQALLKICVEHLGMDLEKAECLYLYSFCDVDELPLLDDILTGGIYGAQDKNRLHSANMTISAVSAEKNGKKSMGLRASLFPSYEYMSANYPYLKKNRLLLPIAWLQRIFVYMTNRNEDTNLVKSIKIGKQRIELLKKYKLL